ncbi:MAG TPA: triphosphoribosyl-dephospho-CoA synthase, partial [Rectinemataceae bacterium]|nr:triphosphoribosyl-dephospho-CoA synthase [Rectinemataceae bacterium]
MSAFEPSPRSLGSAASRSLVAEAALAPKPGLVDPRRPGPHADMDFELLVASARALEPCFVGCAAEGRAAAQDGARPGGMLPTLRAIGLKGEEAMFRTTRGVNTHKGSVFALGLLVAASSYDLARGGGARGTRPPFGDRACARAAEILRGLGPELVIGNGRERSHGERLFDEYGIRGARGQAEDGFPVLRGSVLPVLRAAASAGKAMEVASVDAL